MPILNMGEKLNSLYLERFSPPENVPVRISVLSKQVIGTEYHWVDLPRADVKGSFKCCGGSCCQIFGVRNQNYHVPVFVYSNPQGTEGAIFDWSMTKSVYNDLCTLASRYDITQYDIEVVVTRLGQGRRTALTLVPEASRRTQMAPDQLESINSSVQAFFQVGEQTLVQDMTEQGYIEMAMRGGYNFQTRSFDMGLPMGGTGAGMPNMLTPPTYNPIPTMPYVEAPIGAPPVMPPPIMPTASTGVPPIPPVSNTGFPPQVPPVEIHASPVQAGTVPPVQTAPVQVPPVQAVPVQPAPAQVVPEPVQTQQAIAPSQTTPPNVGEVKPLTADEIDSLLDI